MVTKSRDNIICFDMKFVIKCKHHVTFCPCLSCYWQRILISGKSNVNALSQIVWNYLLSKKHLGRMWFNQSFHYVRFEVLTAVTMKNGVFWDVTPCSCCKNQEPHGVVSQNTPFFSLTSYFHVNTLRLLIGYSVTMLLLIFYSDETRCYIGHIFLEDTHGQGLRYVILLCGNISWK
jgi:hypothetical protein